MSNEVALYEGTKANVLAPGDYDDEDADDAEEGED